MERDHLRAQWVAGDDAFGMAPSFREGLAALGMGFICLWCIRAYTLTYHRLTA